MDVVDTAADAAGLELSPLVVREPLEEFLDAHGIGAGPPGGRADRRGTLEHHLPRAPRRRASGAAATAAPAPAALGTRRAPRGSPAAGAGGHAGSRAGGARRGRRRVHPRSAVLRDGGDPRERARQRDPARARLAGRAPPDRGGAGRRARRGARRGLAGLRARGLRQAHRLPRAPAAPLHRPLGAQQDARARRRRGARRVAPPATCRTPPRRRSCTATTGSAT